MGTNVRLKWNDLESTLFKLVQHNELQKVREFFRKIGEEDTSELSPILGSCKHIINLFSLKKSGDTVLHLCARLGYFELFKYFVEEEGANIEQLNKEGKTALHDAAQFSNAVIVQYLLHRGANINVVKKADWTPLMLACTKPENSDVVRLLVAAGADLAFVNKDGWNCVHLAAREGNVDIVSMLLGGTEPLSASLDRSNRGGNYDLSQTKSKNGRRPLHTAVMHGHLEVSQLLLNHQPDPAEDINTPDHCGITPLMDACRFGYLHIFNYLLKLGGNLHQINQQGQNCLHVAAEAGQTSLIEELVNNCGMNVDEPAQDDAKMRPLQWAAKEGHVNTIALLLKLNADTSLQDAKGRTAYDLATTFGQRPAAQVLAIG
ncbi:ankyrin repeat domain-containing protein 16-like isoform X1 [Folsomia candida]|uniref:ankyrin repeat domain-containing protein 16-like isoform X1 n=1 Tax=Folsomia candida TaxID=158441 RepID=UPI000B8FCC64|nr:ankyrin repeat domain-containing protein 16-like isoform X1 [Folsomia candida]